MWPERGVPIVPVATQTPAELGTTDGFGGCGAGCRTWRDDARMAGAGIGDRRLIGSHNEEGAGDEHGHDRRRRE